VFIEVSERCVNLATGQKDLVNSHGIHDREKCFKVLALDITEGYDGVQGFMITDTKLGKRGGEVERVPREKVSVNAVERAVDLWPCQ